MQSLPFFTIAVSAMTDKLSLNLYILQVPNYCMTKSIFFSGLQLVEILLMNKMLAPHYYGMPAAADNPSIMIHSS